ncbi:STAS domain-containing protein [Streptosporangium amethystogenes]|uniref:STAS domain-containing protein n=1 Tax=Streptosporangium amethystogenes TaxID=2002 RepID=UPI0037A2D6D8
MPPEGVNALSVSAGAHEGAIVVRAIGELDYVCAPVFRREIDRFWSTDTDDSPLSPPSLLPEGPPSPSPLVPDTRAEAVPLLILDLAGLTFCDSTGLAELLRMLRQSQEMRTRLVVTGASRTLLHMLATTGLLSYFTMAASVEEALPFGGALPVGEAGTTED